MNSGLELLVLLSIVDRVVNPLVEVVTTYLKARPTRKVIITTEDNTVIHCEGLSQVELESTIALARRLDVLP